MKKRKAIEHDIVWTKIVHRGASMSDMGLVLPTVTHQLGLPRRSPRMVKRGDGLVIAPNRNLLALRRCDKIFKHTVIARRGLIPIAAKNGELDALCPQSRDHSIPKAHFVAHASDNNHSGVCRTDQTGNGLRLEQGVDRTCPAHQLCAPKRDLP